MTLLPPTSIPNQNNHRVVHFSAQPDSDRLQEMTADAIAHLRCATDAAHTLPTANQRAVRDAFRKVTVFALRGDVLSPESQIAATDLIDALDDLLASGSASEAIMQIQDDLRAAMKLGRRVFDLIVAEHQIEILRIGLHGASLEDLESNETDGSGRAA
jgi:hypothetical protein